MRDTGVTSYDMAVRYASSTTVQFFIKNATFTYLIGGTAVDNSTPITFNAGDFIYFKFDVPIVGWSSNVTMANRAVEEYAYNTSTATTGNDTTSFGYGSTGNRFYSITASGFRRVRFQTPILETDRISVEVFNGTAGTGWTDIGANGSYGTGVSDGRLQNTTYYGIGIGSQINSTDVDVLFGTYALANGATYASAGAAWSTVGSVAKWRVRKVSGGASVGYPIGARNIVGDTTGTTVPTGMIGEVRNSAASTTAHTVALSEMATLSIPPGVWSVTAMTHMSANSTARFLLAHLSTIAGAGGAGTYAAGTRVGAAYATTLVEGDVIIPNVIVNILAPTPYYLNVQTDTIAGLTISQHWIRAVRIA